LSHKVDLRHVKEQYERKRDALWAKFSGHVSSASLLDDSARELWRTNQYLLEIVQGSGFATYCSKAIRKVKLTRYRS
jgi:hypothetical protein